uniref:Uncharacterized protein n=1 Tax=Plectus sambesii TaxID=2011161 RepID=A0A914WX93_9BILA
MHNIRPEGAASRRASWRTAVEERLRRPQLHPSLLTPPSLVVAVEAVDPRGMPHKRPSAADQVSVGAARRRASSPPQLLSSTCALDVLVVVVVEEAVVGQTVGTRVI